MAGSKNGSTRIAGYVIAAVGLLMVVSGFDSQPLSESEFDTDNRYNVEGVDLLGAGMIVLGYRQPERIKSFDIRYRPKPRSVQFMWNVARW